MKKTILTLAIVLMAAQFSAVFAQETPVKVEQERVKLSPEEKAKKKTQKMKSELGLTKAQEEKIYVANLEHARAMEDLRKEKEALRARQKDLRHSHKSQVTSILTKEQNIKLEALAKEKREKARQRCATKCNHHVPPPPPPAPPVE